MATVTKSIGSGKDYATVLAWEAASYGATGADDAVGQVFGTVTEATQILINDTTPLSIVLQGDPADRHGGVEGAGAGLLLTNGSNPQMDMAVPMTVEWLEIDGNDVNKEGTVRIPAGGTDSIFRQNLLHGKACARSGLCTLLYVSGGGMGVSIYDNIVSDLSNSGTGQAVGIRMLTPQQTSIIYNNTVRFISNTNGSSGDASGIVLRDDADHTYKNNLVSDITSTSGTAKDYDGTTVSSTFENNTSEDATGNNQETVSFDANHHLSADPTNDGADLGAIDAAIDITGRDRDTEGDVWDVGAYQFVAAPGGLTISVSESLNATEYIGPDMPLAGVSKSDLINIIESIVSRLAIENLSFETITVQELAQALVSVAPSVFEQMTVNEFVSMLVGMGAVDVNELINITESVTAAMKLAGIDVFETITLTEYVNMQIEGVVGDLTITGQEIINISEYVVAALPLLTDKSETITVAESITAQLLLSQSKFESLTVAEIVNLILPLAASVNESITVGQFVNVVIEQIMNFYENLTVSEFVNVSIAGIVGYLNITWDAKAPGFTWDAKKPAMIYSAKRPTIIFTNE